MEGLGQRLLELLTGDWEYALLLFLRVTGLVFSSPIFGRQNIPVRVRVSFSLAVAGAMLFAAPVQSVPVEGVVSFVLICLTEFVFGVVLGFVTTMFFALTYTAGNLMDMQMSFGMVNVYDPQAGAQVPVTGNMYNIILLLVFFAVGGHLRLVETLYLTVARVPVGTVALSPELGVAALEAFSRTMVLAMNVAMPFVASGLLIEVAMGIIIRSVPQMNMFVVGMPLKVFIGFFMLLLVMPVYVRFTPQIFDEMFDTIEAMFSMMMPAA